MAIQHIETLDDPVQTTGSLQWSGQVSGTKPNRIQDDEAAELVNVDLTPDGMLCPRPGIKRWGVNMYLSIYPEGAKCFIRYIETPVGRYLFAMGSTSVMASYDARQLWIFTESKTCLTATEWSEWDCHMMWGNSDVLPDLANYIAYAQLINVVYVAAQKKWIDAVILPDSAGGSVTYDRVSTFADGTTPLPNISYVAEHRGRVLAVQKNTDIIWPSSILGVASTGGALVSFDFTDGIRVGKGEGDPILALVPSRNNEVLVFCRHSVWSVDANPLQSPAEWTITSITRQVGLVGPDAWTWVGNDVWFLSDAGITSVRRVIAGDDQEISPVLSNPIKDLIDRINPAFRHTIRAVTWDSRVIWAVPLDGNDQPSTALVYNIETAHWMGRWDAMTWSLEITKFGGVKRLFSQQGSDPLGGVYEWDPDIITDTYTIQHEVPKWELELVNERPVESTVRTKSYNWGDFKQLKSPESMEVECWEGAGEMDVMVQLDGQDESTLYPFLTVAEDVSLDVLPRFPLRFPVRFEWNNSVRRGWDLLMRPGMRECRELAVVLKLRGRWRLREIMVNAFINTYEIEI